MSIHHLVFSLGEADLDRITAEPALVVQLFDCEPGSRDAARLPRERCELADTWAAIDFALTGSIDSAETPLGFVLGWGTPIGDVDVGYGPARAITAAEVRELATALLPITATVFATRLDLERFDLEGVYHAAHLSVEDVVEVYDELRTFVMDAAERHRALVVALV